jgi:rRNA-processing protein FCF1
MSTNVKNKVPKNTLVRNVERHYGVTLGYTSDAELHKSLKERGLPTLSKLLKQTRFAK